jgi:hypothetical protein
VLSLQTSSPGGYQWQIVIYYSTSGNLPLITPMSVNLTVADPSIGTVLSVNRTVSMMGLGGTFTLSLDGNTTTRDIPYNASAADVRDALEAMSHSPRVVVTVQGYGEQYNYASWLITFVSPAGPIPLLQIDVTKMTSPTGIVWNGASRQQAGSFDVFLDPIPGEYLRVSSRVVPCGSSYPSRLAQ